VLQSFVATGYEKIQDCREITHTLQKAKEGGKRYEELLKRIKDQSDVEK
jgi:hypothetical protein